MHRRQLCFALLLLLAAQMASAQTPKRNLCALFTAAEMKTLLGTAVEGGEPAAMGTGCQWFGKDEKSYVIIQMVGAEYWTDPKQAPGYEAMQGVGMKAYSHPDMQGGWRAMALTNDAAASVVLIGASAKRASAVTLLRQLLERR